MNYNEFSLLMSALSNRERLDNLLKEDPSDIFAEPDSLTVFKSLQEMVSDGIEPDLSTLSVRLHDSHGTLASEIISRLASSPVTVHFESLKSELKRTRSRFRVQNFARDLIDTIKCGGTLETAVEKVEAFQEKLTRIDKEIYSSIKDMAATPLDDVFLQHAPTPTGLSVIDSFLPGLYGGQLFILAARPGLGKTSLALQIASNLPDNVLFFSLEMSRQEIYARRLSGLADVEAWRVETARLSGGDAARVIEAREAIKARDGDVIVVDRVSDINRIISITRKFIRRGVVSAIFIDYLQLIAGGRGENQNLRIADITRRLKQAAMEYQVPVILLSQLNRNIEYRDREPVLSDLRDSGAIEQDADVVIFLHENKGGGHYIYFAKNRKGRIGRAEVQFEKRYTRFLSNAAGRMQNLCN